MSFKLVFILRTRHDAEHHPQHDVQTVNHCHTNAWAVGFRDNRRWLWHCVHCQEHVQGYFKRFLWKYLFCSNIWSPFSWFWLTVCLVEIASPGDGWCSQGKWKQHILFVSHAFPMCFHIPFHMQRCHRHFTGMGAPGPRGRPADFLLGSRRQ